MNFLIAGLISRTHGLHDTTPAKPSDISNDPTLDTALEEYVRQIPASDTIDPSAALTALAFAEAPGFTPRLWSVAIASLFGVRVAPDALLGFARSEAANFLVEDTSRGDHGLRLFHQALNDTLLVARARLHPRPRDERSLVQDFLADARRTGWDSADNYLLRNLATHAERAGDEAIDDLLADDTYLLHADLRRLGRVARRGTGRYRRRARLIGLATGLDNWRGSQRAARLSVLDAVLAVDTGIDWRAVAPDVPYYIIGSQVRDQVDIAVHTGHTSGVSVVCTLEMDGRRCLSRRANVWSASGSPRPRHHPRRLHPHGERCMSVGSGLAYGARHRSSRWHGSRLDPATRHHPRASHPPHLRGERGVFD